MFFSLMQVVSQSNSDPKPSMQKHVQKKDQSNAKGALPQKVLKP